MAKHQKIRPFKCNICDWSTCYNGNMWKHMQMHKIKDGILLPGKPKRATKKGIRYDTPKRLGKLLPITIDGFEVTPDQDQSVAATTAMTVTSKNTSDKYATSQIMSLPITLGSMGDGTTIVMVPEVSEKSPSVLSQQQQQEHIDEAAKAAAQVVNFNPGIQEAEETVALELDPSQTDGESKQQEEVMISVSGRDNQNIQQSISSIITSMAASAAAAEQESTTSSITPTSTLIETQLSASEVASHFEDGTIIEITQIPTSGDGTALIPEGAIVEKITPGMSASDIIMKAANMVASGQTSRSNIPSSGTQYLFPIAVSKESGTARNTLPFLAQVATAQESLPKADTIQIIEEMEVNMVAGESGVEGGGSSSEEVIEQHGEIEQQLVATILPDENNVMQIIQPTTHD